MVDIIITYETLFDILRKEKSREELQELADDFYLQAFAFLKSKMENASDDYFAKSHIQLRNAKKILKELFERRERKIINLAIDSARTENMLINKEAMTPKEKTFFEEALNFVKLHKMKIIGPALTGVMPDDLPEYNNPNKKKVVENKKEIKNPEPKKQQISSTENAEEAVSIKLQDKKEEYGSKDPQVFGELKVKIKSSLPKFLGPDGKVLGPFNEGEEATLPEKVARILEKKGKAKVI